MDKLQFLVLITGRFRQARQSVYENNNVIFVLKTITSIHGGPKIAHSTHHIFGTSVISKVPNLTR